MFHEYPVPSDIRWFNSLQIELVIGWRKKIEPVSQKRSSIVEFSIFQNIKIDDYHRSFGTWLPFLWRRICRNSSNRLRRGRSKVETATSFVNLHWWKLLPTAPPRGNCQFLVGGACVSCNEEFSHKSELLMDPRVSGKRVPGKKIDRAVMRVWPRQTFN